MNQERRCRALTVRGTQCTREGSWMRGDLLVCARHARTASVIAVYTGEESRLLATDDLKGDLSLLVKHADEKGRANTARIAQAALDRIRDLERQVVEAREKVEA